MKKVYLTIGTVLLLAFISALAVAKPGAGEGKGYGVKNPHKMHRGSLGGGAGYGIGIILRFKEKVGLDAKQVEQLKVIKNEIRGQFKANAEVVRTKRDALQKVVESGASESVIRAAASEIGNAIGDQAVLRVSTKAKVDGVLTADQKAKLEELKKEQIESYKGQRGEVKRVTNQGTKGRRKEHGKNARDPESEFARIDADGNDAISLEEFKTHMEQMKERRGDRRPRDRRGRPEGPAGESED